MIKIFFFKLKNYSSNLSSSKTVLNTPHLAHSPYIKKHFVQVISVSTVYLETKMLKSQFW